MEQHHAWKKKAYQHQPGSRSKSQPDDVQAEEVKRPKFLSNHTHYSTCIGKSPEKKITDSVDKPYYDEMHERLKTPKAKRMKKLRSSTVEPVLGTLINFMGMRRIWTRGIEQADKFMLGAAIAYNLKKYLKFSRKKVKTAAIKLKKESIVQAKSIVELIKAFYLPLNPLSFQ